MLTGNFGSQQKPAAVENLTHAQRVFKQIALKMLILCKLAIKDSCY
jgi:hypothetical protein